MEVVHPRRTAAQADAPERTALHIPEATSRVLDLQLKELVDDGLASETIFTELPPRSVYAITPLGMSLVPIIDAMLQWGEKNRGLFERKYGHRATASDPTGKNI